MAGPDAVNPGRPREVWTLMLLGVICLFLFADQNLLAPNLTQVARDFGLDDVDRDVKLGGQISLFYWIVGGTVALGLGFRTDRFPRKPLFTAVVLLGAVPCFLSGLARTYPELFLCRVLTGIGIGGALPLAFSLINAPETRGSVVALFNLADDLGKGLGSAVISVLVAGMGRQAAFNVATLGWLFCGAVLLGMARTFPRDEALLAQRLRAGQDRAAA